MYGIGFLFVEVVKPKASNFRVVKQATQFQDLSSMLVVQVKPN